MWVGFLIYGLQERLFHVSKRCVLRCIMDCFALQKRLYHHAEKALSQRVAGCLQSRLRLCRWQTDVYVYCLKFAYLPPESFFFIPTALSWSWHLFFMHFPLHIFCINGWQVRVVRYAASWHDFRAYRLRVKAKKRIYSAFLHPVFRIFAM